MTAIVVSISLIHYQGLFKYTYYAGKHQFFENYAGLGHKRSQYFESKTFCHENHETCSALLIIFSSLCF